MKHLLVVIWAVVVLVAVVTGCSGSHYDQRLVAADSLMAGHPDSALALVEGIDTASLTTAGDRAYRDLLLTQARYKCYITATSDSDINRALNYYRSHSGEREKLTRSYIYKGAVMEELGHPDSAMYYYKTAEANADEKDYGNLGQINTRIADLYRLYYADEQICYEKYHKALKYHRLTNNKRLQINCLFNMAGCSGVINAKESKKLLNQAYKLALHERDSLNCYLCLELLCRQLSMQDSSITEAKRIGLDVFEHYSAYINYGLLLDLSHIYVRENNVDSAYFFLSMIDESAEKEDAQVQARKLDILSKIAQLKGDTSSSYHFLNLSTGISDSIINNKHKYLIQSIEDVNNAAQKDKSQRAIHGLHYLVVCIIAVTAILILGFIYYHYRRIHYIKSIIREMEHSDVNRHEDLLRQVDAQDAVIERFVQNMVAFMQQSIDASEKDSPTVIRRRLKESIKDVANDDFWMALQRHLDKNHDNIIAKIAQNSRITDSDLHFIELSCCGFNYVEIAIALGFSPNYISNKRKIIARKLGLRKISLQDYLSKAMK